jgi:hypothetical protein
LLINLQVLCDGKQLLLNVYPDLLDTKGDVVTDLGGRFKCMEVNSVLAEPRLAGLNFKFNQFNRHKKRLVLFFAYFSGTKRISILKLKDWLC